MECVINQTLYTLKHQLDNLKFSLIFIKYSCFKRQSECKNVNVIIEKNGKNIVLINDIRFRTRRTIEWEEVEEYLKKYIGKYYEILETSEKVYISTDFPDEFCHSRDKIKLKGRRTKSLKKLYCESF